MKRARGFTLLEVLIALAMLAIVLSAAFRGIGMVAGQAGELGERHVAKWIAQNRLAQHRVLKSFPDPGNSEGVEEQAGYKFKWHEDYKTMDNVTFRRIDIKVMREDNTILARMTSVVAK